MKRLEDVNFSIGWEVYRLPAVKKVRNLSTQCTIWRNWKYDRLTTNLNAMIL